MAIKITDLGPASLPLAGTEQLEIVQNGMSRRVAADDIAASAAGLDATFVTISANAILPNERVITAGTNVSLVDGGPNSTITINALTQNPFSTPLGILGDINTVTPPLSEAITVLLELRDLQDVNVVGTVGFNAVNDLQLRNSMRAGTIQFRRISGGATDYVATELGDGILILYSTDDLDGSDRYVSYRHQTGLERGRVGFDQGDWFTVKSLVHGGIVRIEGEESGGTARIMGWFDPDANVLLYYDNITKFITQPHGFQVKGDGVNAPTGGGTQNTSIPFINNSSAQAAIVGFVSSSDLQLASNVHGGHVTISGEDTATGATRIGFEMDPDGVTIFRYGDLSSVDGGVEFSAPDADTPFRITPLNAGVPVADFIDYNIDRDDWEIRGDVEFTDNPATSRTVTFNHDVIINGADRFIQAPLTIGNASNHGSTGSGDIYFVSDAGSNRGLFLGRQFFAQNLTDKGASQFGAVFDTSTSMTDPGLYDLRFNNATPASVTEIAIDDTGIGGHDFGDFWGAELVSGDKLFIKQVDDDTRWIIFTLTGSPVDQTGFWTMPVSVDSSGVLPVNTEEVNVEVILASVAPQASITFDLLTDINTGTPPTTENVTGNYRIRDAQNVNTLMELGYTNTEDLLLQNLMQGGEFAIEVTDTVGAVFTVFEANPVSGTIVLGDRTVQLAAGGRTFLIGDGFASPFELTLFHNDVATAFTASLADGGFEVNNDYNGGASLERVLSASDVMQGLNVVRYNFSTGTGGGDPGFGQVAFNNATPASITQADFDDLATNQINGEWLFPLLADGDLLTFRNEVTTSEVIILKVSGPAVDQTGFWEIPVTHVTGALPSNNADLRVTWQQLSEAAGGAGTVTASGSPLNNQIAVFTGPTDIDSNAGFTYDATKAILTGTVTRALEVHGPSFQIVVFDSNSAGDVLDHFDMNMQDNICFLQGTDDSAALTSAMLNMDVVTGVVRIGNAGGEIFTNNHLHIEDNFQIRLGDLAAGDVVIDWNSATPGLEIEGAASGQSVNWRDGMIHHFYGDDNVDRISLSVDSTANTAELTTNNINSLTIGEGGMAVRFSDAGGLDHGQLFHNGTEFQISTGSGDGEILLFREGAQRSLVTQSTVPNTSVSSAVILDNFNNALEVGFALMPTIEDNPAGLTMGAQHAGQTILMDDDSAFTVTIPASTNVNFPVGAITTLINANSAAVDMTLSDNATGTLFYLDGSSVTDIAGTATIGPGGVANIWRRSTTEWYLWGTGITP